MRGGIALILVLGVTFAGTAAASERFFDGIVLAVAPSRHWVSVEEAGIPRTRRTFTIPRDVSVRKAGTTVDLASVKVGDPVAIEYAESGNKAVAKSVEVLGDPTRPVGSAAGLR